MDCSYRKSTTRQYSFLSLNPPAGGGNSGGDIDECPVDGCGDGSSEGDDGEGASGTVRLNAMHACTSQAALVVNTLDEKCAISNTFMSAFKFDDRMLAVGIVGVAGIDGAGS